ncbi:hypothetical protein HZA57_04665 [Candidatus Poribacteria bacterium]|nr:hypothetical protein [Candidatus Poribacteria bacterium]
MTDPTQPTGPPPGPPLPPGPPPDPAYAPPNQYAAWQQQTPPRKSNTPLIITLVVVGVLVMIGVPCLGVLVAIAVPGFLKAREQSRINACTQNMAMIEAAKETWAGVQTVQDYETEPTWDDLVNKGGYLAAQPVCPSGGTYDIGSLEEYVDCSAPGHDYYGEW